MDPNLYQEHKELENQHWWFLGRRAYLRRLIQRCYPHPRKDLSFCEIGSGTGGNLPMLCSFAAVDSIEMNNIARQEIINKNIEGVNQVLAGSLPDDLPNIEDYDAIFALDVVEHIDDDIGSLEKIFQHVKPNGFFIATVPAYQWLWSQHDVSNHHKRRYTKTQFVERVRQAGFRVEYSSYFNSLLFPIAATGRVFGKLISKPNDATETSLRMPPRWLNFLLLNAFKLESLWAGKMSLPVGVSIAVIAKKVDH